jgi:hypothetical protein
MVAMQDQTSSRRDILPVSLAPLGLSRVESATYVGVGATLFDEMVADGRMPPPRVFNGRTVWDREELYAAFKAVPHRGIAPAKPASSDWGRVV